MERCSDLNTYFYDLFKELKCQEETKSYIVSVFTKFKKSEEDLSPDSITILYFDARTKQDFSKFQQLGDWIFFTSSIAEQYNRHASKVYYDTIRR